MSGYRRRSTHPQTRVPAPSTPRFARARRVLPVFASAATLAFVAAAAMPQTYSAEAAPISFYSPAYLGTQTFQAEAALATTTTRDGYGVTKPTPVTVTPSAGSASSAAAAPRAAAPSPGTAQAIAHDMVIARGWSESEFSCLVALWGRESGWNTHAGNASGAYGIPQALPGSKMASVGPNWRDDAATQITWGLGYISGRYGTPCVAWGSSQSRGWY